MPEQERARNALACVDGLHDKSQEFKKLYRAYTDRLGPTIVMNGLGQALATERAAAGAAPKSASCRENAHRALYDNIQDWLCSDGGVYPARSDLLKAIMKGDESHYLRAQAEALSWLEWHKKFCRAALPKSDGGSD